MSKITWKQVVLDVADAYREASDTTDKIPLNSLADKVRAGAGTPYTGDNPLLLGQEGYTFPAKTLLKEELQIVNGVSGEDLTETVVRQDTSADELLKIVNRVIADHKGEGQYVWEKILKGEAGGTVSFGQDTYMKNPTLVEAYSDDIDMTVVNENFFVGITGSLNSEQNFVFVSNTQIEVRSKSTGEVIETWNYTYDPSTQMISIDAKMALHDWGSAIKESNDVFIGYVVSSDVEAYPNGAVHTDGYWYELPKEGVFGIDYGEVTPTATSETITVSHSLGVVPSQVYFIAKNFTVNGDIAMISKNIIGSDPGWARSYYGFKPGQTSAPEGITITTISATDKTITHTPNISANLQASKTYYWIAIA